MSFNSSGAVALTESEFGRMQVSFLLDDMRCNGEEESLIECPHAGIGVHNCRSHEIAGVRCRGMYSKRQNTTLLRDNVVHVQGRKEIAGFLSRYILAHD